MRKGFVENYYEWEYHQNTRVGTTSNNVVAVVEEQSSNNQNPYSQMVYDAVASIFPDNYHQFLPRQFDVVPVHNEPPVHVDEYPNPQCRQFFEMLNAVNSPLFEGCKTHTKMSIIARLTTLKTDHRLTERCYDEFCAIVNEVIPDENTMVNSFYDTKKQIAALGLPVEKIDCCPNGCMIYWGNNANATCCHACETSRWRRNSKGDKVSRKQFHYFPLGPRLQRLYASEATARHMRWHAEHRTKDGEVIHP